jgi:hypothetical protein
MFVQQKAITKLFIIQQTLMKDRNIRYFKIHTAFAVSVVVVVWCF